MTKNISQSKMKWLTDELPDLQAKQVIDEATAQRLIAYYQAGSPGKPSSQRYFLLFLVILGSLLVGGGIILLFAYNWDSLMKYQRVATAFIPVVIAALCGSYTIIKEKDARWREFSAIFTAASFAVLIALISQIYHTGGTFTEYMKLLLLLSLPLVYIFGSRALTALYCLGLFSLNGYMNDPSDIVKLAYIGGIAPYMCTHLFLKPHTSTTVLMRYLVLLPLLFITFSFDYYDTWGVMITLTSSMLFVGGLVYRDMGIKGANNPWLITGWVFFTIVMALSSVGRNFFFWENTTCASFRSLPLLLHLIWLTFFAVSGFFALYKRTPIKLMSIVLPILTLLNYYGITGSLPMFMIGNIYFAAFGITTLVYGMRNRLMVEMNAGMIQLVLLIMLKFFDSDLSILWRAIAFIVIGSLFIAANVYLSRRFKKSETEIKAVNKDE